MASFAVGAVRTVVAADVPSSEQVREAAARSLPYLEKEGVKWMQEKACITCHQIPSMIWSLDEAQRHGLKVDTADLKAWSRWAVDNGLRRGEYFEVTDAALSKLREAKVPDADVAKLEPIKKRNYVFPQDFTAALTKQLTASRAAEHEATIFKACLKPKQGGTGGGSNNQYTALLMAGAPRAAGDAGELQTALVAGLVKSQKPDGSWDAAGQFRSQQRTADEANEVCTQWTVFALASLEKLPVDAEKAITKARDWLKTRDDGDLSVEKLMLRAMLAKQSGDEATSKKLLDELLKLQHTDGGWAWLKDRKVGDPLTTGQVLYGLSYLGRDGTDPAVRKASQYLLSKQDKDGIWPFIANDISASKKVDRKDADYIYTYWTTGWATIGLLSTLPK